MRKIFLLLILGIFVSLNLFLVPSAYSDELDDITKKLSELQAALSASQKATAPLESQLKGLQTQLAGIESRVGAVDRDLALRKKEIDEGYKQLDENKTTFNQTVRDYYIKGYLLSPLLVFLSSSDVGEITRLIVYQKRDADKDKDTITSLALKLVDLEERKEKLEVEEKKLASIKTTLASEKGEIEKVVKGAKDYQGALSGEIAQLSARQNEIINARSGGFTASIGTGELADEYLSSIKGFRESAPSGSFAIFSFGGYTHRKGMSQYGARGRAQSGQNFSTILNAYYGKSPVSKDTGGTIKVTGHGEMDFEGRYLLGIAEMPSTWHPEALKAQAVAARTYAFRYKQEGKEICTTEACQVFNSGKADNPPDAWRQAVNDTRGQVLEDVVTYYASTHGGYASPIGWDTTDGSGGDNFIDRAYDKIGGSPWLYKAWWRQGYSNSGSTCGRSNPWLNGEEMADLVNAAIALRTGGIDTSRITPITTSCWGGSPYTMAELRDLVAPHGGISSATSVSVSQGNGNTNSVVINGISISATDFKKALNLRGPGYVSIPQSGFAFFNIEKK